MADKLEIRVKRSNGCDERSLTQVKGYLALEDGTIYEGKAFGSEGKQCGEVVFNTSMCGYQKILTDPSYCGEIVVLTYPLIGNYGINKDDYESERPWVKGFVVKELCDYPSNWRYWIKAEEFCQRYGVPGVCGIDTRALTRRLRSFGTMRGIIATGDYSPQELVTEARQSPSISGQDLVCQVTSKARRTTGDGEKRVVVVDFGVKAHIVKNMVERGCTVELVPATTTAEEIIALRPDGVILSNGPGDPKDVPYAVEMARSLIGKLPVMGICLGHQILGLACGGDTYKLKFGHRGTNHPVQELVTGRVFITSQNHGFAVDESSLPADQVEVSFKNLNDGTVEGLRYKELPVFSVQFHPEGSPGILDTIHLFDRFKGML